MKINLYMQPYRDVFHDVPVEYVQKCIKDETLKEEKRVKSWFEKTLLFFKLKKPWIPPRHVIYNNCIK